jgi:hypothetical protein
LLDDLVSFIQIETRSSYIDELWIEIAFAFCPFNAADATSTAAPPDYKASCRDVAEGICEGAIYGYVHVQDNGCSISTSQLNDLQDECGDQIDSMLGLYSTNY